MNNIITILPVSSFDTSKTRLSPFLSNNERKELLKSMLKDIVSNIKNEAFKVIVISNDKAVLKFARDTLQVDTLKENKYENNYLNNAIIDAVEYVKKSYGEYNILVLPSDIPLNNNQNITYLKCCDADIIISPSKGGGTNLLFFKNTYDFKPLFGEFSFFKHLNEAKEKDMSIKIYDSFYLSIDINTPQDLGEFLLHGKKTETYNYLSSLNISVTSVHGQERLNVKRENE